MTYIVKKLLDPLPRSPHLPNYANIESYDKLAGALHAYWILTAHELRNGRTCCYRLFDNEREITSVRAPVECDLPSWATEALRKAGFE